MFKKVPQNFKPKPTYDHFVYAPVRKSAPARELDGGISAPAREIGAPAKSYPALGLKNSVAKKTTAPAGERSAPGGMRLAPAAASASAPGDSRADRILEDLEKQYGMYKGERSEASEVNASVYACFGMGADFVFYLRLLVVKLLL